jgi:hypothetical protein
MPHNLLSLAALVAALVLSPMTVANAAEDSDDFGSEVKAFFAGAADGVEGAAEDVEDGAEKTIGFFKDEVDDEDDDDDLGFKAPWAKK